MFDDLPGYVDVQEAIPAASSPAKPRAEEAVSQGTASEPLAQECLRGNGNSRETIGKTQIGSEKDERHIWTDGMTVMNQLLIFLSIIESPRNVSLQMEQF